MKSYSVYFVRNTNIELLHSMFSIVDTLPDSEWLMCNFNKDDYPPDDDVLWGKANMIVDKSVILGEVLFLYGDTSCDGFVYEHALHGKMLRKLVWFPMLDDDWTAGWLYVTGDSEAWESQLFPDHQLTQYLEAEQERLEDLGQADQFGATAQEIKEAWQKKQIIAGKTFPPCDGTVGILVEQYYKIHRPMSK
jgi:hypothetical protein